ncbi:MAG: coenzyme F420-0:L-glutamate ligase, partial [Dehalococcoidia bacterium]
RTEKDPRIVEAVLRESKRVIRQVGGVLLTETHHGFKCANAGVDGSNVGGMDLVSLLPVDPDASCRTIREGLRAQASVEVAVVMTDTFGRPWRHGQTNVAIGVAGMLPFRDYVGKTDTDGRVLRVTTICVADEIAGAAEMVMGKLDAIPAAIVRGYDYDRGDGAATEIVREQAMDLFP